MRWFRFLLVAILAVLLQTTLVRVLTVRGARPDLMVAVLVVFSVGARRSEGFAVGCLAGVLRDLFSIEPFGLSTGSFALLGYVLARGRAGAMADHALTHAVLGLVCSAASSGVSLAAIALAKGARGPTASSAAAHLALTALLTAVASGLVGAAVWRRRRWFGLRRGAEFMNV